MKKINELYDCPYDIDIYDIKINSKEVKPGDLFVCIKGVNCDRHDFIEEAISHGASFLIVKKDGKYRIPYLKVANPNQELAKLASKFYDYPDMKLKLIGITGTDGKTTTAMIIRSMLGKDVCGYIGTNGIKGYKIDESISNTTPECHLIYKVLYLFNQENLQYASMETSSEAFYRKRLDPFLFDVGILTNITEDHLNIHKTIANYVSSKKQLFRQLKKQGVAILNIDDFYYQEFKDLHSNVLTYGQKKEATLWIKEIIETNEDTKIHFIYKNKDYFVCSPLLGKFNVYNLSAALLTLTVFGISIEEGIERIKNIDTPNGRCEVLNFDTKYKIILDYAHTPNGLLSVLEYLNKIKMNRIITVVGSAGGREQEKRSKMGKVVLEKSDLVIFTTDDPRFEDPNQIINEMIDTNVGNYKKIIKREDAIKYALDHAQENDIVLIAGKGRDRYMAIEDQYIPYCDYDVITSYFKK